MNARLEAVDDQSTWSTDELRSIGRQLQALREQVEERLRSYESVRPECGDAIDVAGYSTQLEFDELSRERDEVLLAQTTHVLDRLHRGVYSVCENCSGIIAKARLQTHPQASLCMKCAHVPQGATS